MSDRPAGISVRSLHRRIDLTTPLDADDETAWLLLLIPTGSTDRQVIEWAEQTLSSQALDELRQRIAEDAGAESTDGGDVA